MKHKKKPHLAGIREFGVAAYVKDLKAGKLDSRAQVGRFVGYDSESKGYRIYWPRKRTVTVERNVVFNENDVHSTEAFTIIPGDPLAEGERDKIIQQPPNNGENAKEPEDQTVSERKTQDQPSETHQDHLQSSSIPFPSTPVKTADTNPEMEDDESEPYGHGQCPRKPLGAYKTLHDGLVAAAVLTDDPPDNEPSANQPVHIWANEPLPPDFALVGAFSSEPRSLDEAL